MNFNNFTIKAQEVIQKAVQLTRTSGNQAIEPEHLLKAARVMLSCASFSRSWTSTP